jgi:hypothetical protein
MKLSSEGTDREPGRLYLFPTSLRPASADLPAGIPPASSVYQQSASRYHTLILTDESIIGGATKMASSRVIDFSYHYVPFSATPAIARCFVSN